MMSYPFTRRAFLGAAATMVGLTALAGCTSAAPQPADKSGMVNKPVVVVGTLPTEDILPLWLVERDGIGLENSDVSVSVVEFQSATELIAGVGSGEVDMAMTDIMVAASMFAGGIDVKMEWVTLGTTPDQGRFGIMVGPNSDVKTLQDLAGVPIGVGTNTILEYVMDCLMEDAGVPADQVVVEELQKLPVRYQAMVSDDVAAAALPGSLLALGEASGCHLVADDSQGRNLSSSVMAVRTDFAEKSPDLVKTVASAWDAAVAKINANPEEYRELLVKSANLSDVVAGTYPISTYPTAQLPTSDMVEPVLTWMRGKGYLTAALSYDETTGAFVSQ